MKLRVNKLSAVAVAAALTLLGVMQAGMPAAHAAPVSWVDGQQPVLRIVNSPVEDAAGNPIYTDAGQTFPQIGKLLLVDTGTVTPATGTTFTYLWQRVNATTGAVTAATNTTNRRSYVPVTSDIGYLIQVTVTATNSPDTAQWVGVTSSAVVGVNQNLTVQPPTTGTYWSFYQNIPQGNAKSWHTFYGYPDNTPPGNSMSSSVPTDFAGNFGAQTIGNGIHRGGAAGTGSWLDPLTAASYNGEFQTGTEIYFPRFHKYFIVEDSCTECSTDMRGSGSYPDGSIAPGDDGGPGMIHVDLWIGGPQGDWPDTILCEDALTWDPTDISNWDDIVVNPAKPADPLNDPLWIPTPIFDPATSTCNLQPDGSSTPLDDSSDVGQYVSFRNVPASYASQVQPGAGLCITDPGNGKVIGTQLTLEPCQDPTNPTDPTKLASQMISFAGMSVMVNNLCFDKGNQGASHAPFDASQAHRSVGAAGSQTVNGTAGYPITLQRCDLNPQQQWELGVNGTISDIQNSNRYFADLGASADGNTYLWATSGSGSHAYNYWDYPYMRNGSDLAPVSVSNSAVVRGSSIHVSFSGLTTPTAELFLLPGSNDASFSDDVKALDMTDAISLGVVTAADDGTFSGDFVVPATLDGGDYQLVLKGLSYELDGVNGVVIPMASDGFSTSILFNSQIYTNSGSGAYQPTPDNFRPVSRTVPIWGLSAGIEVLVPVTGISLDQHTKTLPQGTFFQLTATVAPSDASDKSVTWSTSDPSVAVVYSDGTVTAVGPGTATITATTNDGAFTDTCLVTVTRPVSGVVLDQLTKTLTIPVGVAYGDAFTLTATVQPADATDKNVSWSTSNSVVATVANGVVTARGVGTATITVTTEDGRYSASMVVTVIRLVTGVVLDQSERLLAVADGFDLTALVAPSDATDQTITWSTSDPSVAIVDTHGHVTAVSPGVATITVTTHDGQFTDKCVVTVFQPVFGISVDPTEASLTVGDTLALVATIAPEDATNTNITWASSNPKIATVDENGVVTALKAGQVVITVQTEDGGFTATSVITVQAKSKPSSGTVDTGGSVVATTAPWAGGFGLVLLGAAAMFLRRRSQFGTA